MKKGHKKDTLKPHSRYAAIRAFPLVPDGHTVVKAPIHQVLGLCRRSVAGVIQYQVACLIYDKLRDSTKYFIIVQEGTMIPGFPLARFVDSLDGFFLFEVRYNKKTYQNLLEAVSRTKSLQ